MEERRSGATSQRLVECVVLVTADRWQLEDAPKHQPPHARPLHSVSAAPRPTLLRPLHATPPLHAVASFCFPNGVRLAAKPSPPSYASFVLTDDAYARLYGHALTLHDTPLEPSTPLEQPPPADVAADAAATAGLAEGAAAHAQQPATIGELNASAAVYAPSCLCILSRDHLPLTFRTVLLALHRLACSSRQAPIVGALETSLMHLVDHVPRPVAGGPAIRFSLHPALPPLHASRPLPHELPRAQYSAALLLRRLPPEALTSVVGLLSLEWSLVVVASDAECRLAACELLLGWLHPLDWVQAYAPIVPDGPILDLLRAPFPLLAGLSPLQLAEMGGASSLRTQGRMAVLLLDEHTLLGPTMEPPALPLRDAVPLLSTLTRLAHRQHELDSRVASSRPSGRGGGSARQSAGVALRSSSTRDSILGHTHAGGGEHGGEARWAEGGKAEAQAGARCTQLELDEAVRHAFLRYFASLLRDVPRAGSGTVVAASSVEEGEAAADAAQEAWRGKLVELHPHAARPYARELISTQAFLQLDLSGVGLRPFERALDEFLAEEITSKASRDAQYAHSDLRLAAEAARVVGGAAAEASTDALVDAGVYEVPPPRLADDAASVQHHTYASGWPTSLPDELKPACVPLPDFGISAPPPPPILSVEVRGAWAEALEQLEQRAKRRALEHQVGAGISAGALIGGALAASAVGCVMQ